MMRYLSTLLLALSGPLAAYELITDYSFVSKAHPVHFDGEFRGVGRAKFYKGPSDIEDSHQQYQDAHAFLYYSHYLTPDNSLSWKVGYSFLDFDWKENPRFTGHDYHFASASVGWVSTSVPNWRWILSAGASVDATTWMMCQSGVYYGLMWGRYHMSDTLGMHIGWAGYVGVKNGYFFPIVGIDWQAGTHWKFNAIFPLNISIEYLFDSHWSSELALAAFGRPYRFPMRVHGGIGKYEKGIFEVYSKGLELDLKYKTGDAVHLSVGGGWNFGGWIVIKDHNDHSGAYYKYNGAPYAQGKVEFTF